MTWVHVQRLQVIRATFHQCFMIEFDRAPHSLRNGMRQSGHSGDITMQGGTAENNELDACLQATGYTGNFSSVFHDGQYESEV